MGPTGLRRSGASGVAATPRPHDDLVDHGRKSRAATVSIVSNSVLIVFKVVAGLLSGSIAILSEAVHSGSDLIAAIIAFLAVRRAARPPDEHHQYGHEKVENVSGVVEALLIIGAAVVIIVEAVHKLIDGVTIEFVWVGIVVMFVSGVVNLIVARAVLYPVARRTESAALEADAAHLLTDVYTSFGVAGGLLLVRVTGIEWIDPVAAMAVAGLIVHTGYELAAGSTRVLLDETLEPDELEEIRRCINEHRGTIITGYHRLRARKAGSRRHIDLHLTVAESLSVGEAHDVGEHIAADIRERIPNADVLVHIEPRSHERVDGS